MQYRTVRPSALAALIVFAFLALLALSPHAALAEIPTTPADPPTFHPGSGIYTGVQTVTLADDTPDASIYYTTNGTQPDITNPGELYTGPFSVISKPVFAIAVAPGFLTSTVSSAVYAIGVPNNPLVVYNTGDDPTPGSGSLRSAMTYAEAHPGSTITFHANLTGTIYLASTLPVIAVPMTIVGPGASQVAIDGSDNVTGLEMLGNISVSISGLTIQDCNDIDNDFEGGGIATIEANLTVSDCTLTDNHSTGGGGAIFNDEGTLTVTNCLISDNDVSGSEELGGAGIFSVGVLTVTDSDVLDNFFDTDAIGDGAGILSLGSLTLTDSTVSGNTGADLGGGLALGETGTISGCTLADNSALQGAGMYILAQASVTNCTLTGNEAGDAGGAIFDGTGNPITSCTITDNSAVNSGGGVSSDGNDSTQIVNSILYGDTADTGVEVFVESGGGISLASCDIEGGAGPQPVVVDLGDNFSADPLLNPLASNGGPTQTMSLQFGSPCYVAGTTTPNTPTADQRGQVRPSTPSIGAYDAGVPTAAPQSHTVLHNTPLQITLTGSDAEDSPSRPLFFKIVTQPHHGTLSVLHGGPNVVTGDFSPQTPPHPVVTYTPNPGYQGPDSFTFAGSNGFNSSAPAIVSLSVQAATPTALSGQVNVAHDVATTVTLHAIDGDDNPALHLTYAIVTGPGVGTMSGFNAATGTVKFTPPAGYNGQDGFTFTVTNGQFTSAPTEEDVTVAAAIPHAFSVSVEIAHDAVAGLQLARSDGDNSPQLTLTDTIVTQPAHGMITNFDPAGGSYTYTPAAGYHGPDSFTFTVTDGVNTSPAGTISLTILASTPLAIPITATAPHDGTLSITLASVLGNDSPPLTPTYAIASGPVHGTLTGLSVHLGKVIYTPTPGFQGSDSFTYTVGNGAFTSAPATVTITVQPALPKAAAKSAASPHDGAVQVGLFGSDGDDNPALPLTFTIVSGPAHGALNGFNSATGVVAYTPTTGYHGADSFTYTVSNGVFTTAPSTVTLTVAPAVPQAINRFLSQNVTRATSIVLSGNDRDDSPALPLTYSIVSPPTHGTVTGLNAATGTVNYTPASSSGGPDSFTYRVSNGTFSATGTVNIDMSIP